MKTKTISYGSVKEYATVPARLKEFREGNPNGLIETTPMPQPDGQMIFSTRILKDKSNLSSGEATGHALGKITGTKAFEKLETISVGRALSLLGYMASGDIASSEEMEEFMEYQENKKQEAIDEAIIVLEDCKTLVKLQEVWKSLGPIITEKVVVEKKDSLKAILK